MKPIKKIVTKKYEDGKLVEEVVEYIYKEEPKVIKIEPTPEKYPKYPLPWEPYSPWNPHVTEPYRAITISSESASSGERNIINWQ